MKNLTIIIVTYNSSNIIADCINKINYNLHDVIIVDNASTDNTVALIEFNFPSLKIIKNNFYGPNQLLDLDLKLFKAFNLSKAP